MTRKLSTSLLLLACLLPTLWDRPVVGEKKAKDSMKNDILPPKLTTKRTRVVRTKYGQVQGRIHKVKVNMLARELLGSKQLRDVEVYLGIRYATPPVGPNRWQPTRAPSPWKGVLQAASPGPVCPQRLPQLRNESQALLKMPRARLRSLQFTLPHLARQSEDCLYLNIYAPVGAAGGQHPLAVMVYVHGESFQWGAGNLWDARVLAAYGNVIVVTFNFRLGILGFLNTNGSPLSRGQVSNYGLMDQMAVLQWVQENAAGFGGDTKRVTLFGHGTGAACIEYLVHSPTMVPGLFHRVILMSGSLFAPWSRVRDPLAHALRLARSFNCSVPSDLRKDHDRIADCLRGVPAERLLVASEAAARSTMMPPVSSFHLDFGPSFDGVTVKDNFVDIKGKRSFGSRSYDALVGVTTHDFFDALSDDDSRDGVPLERRDRMLQTFVRNQYTAHLREILLTLQNEYTDWAEEEQTPKLVREQVLSAFTDGLYASPAVYSAGTFFRKAPNTFFYHFAHRAESGPYVTVKSGATHGSELPYVFGVPLAAPGVWAHLGHRFSVAEAKLSARVMTYWTNFAKTGNPNKPLRHHHQQQDEGVRHVTWEPYDDRRKYLELDVTPREGHHYRGHKMSIWLNLIPQLQKSGESSSASFPAHNSLVSLEGGSTWGVLRGNASHVIDKQAAAAAAVGTTCMTLAESQQVLYQHNDTLVRLEEASRHAYAYAIAITAGLGGSLFVLNAAILACLCRRQRRNESKRKQQQQQIITPPSTNSPTSATHRHGSSLDLSNRQQHQHILMADGRHQATAISSTSSSPLMGNIPRSSSRGGGQRTLLVQPHRCGRQSSGGILRSSYVPASRPEPDFGGESQSHPPRPPSASSLANTATIKMRPTGSTGVNLLATRGGGSLMLRGSGGRDEEEHTLLEEMAVAPPPPAEFETTSTAASDFSNLSNSARFNRHAHQMPS